MRLFLFALAVSVGATATLAFAQIPRYDVEAHCDMIAGFGGTYSNEMYNFCIQSEQAAYNALQPMWDSVPGRIQTHCKQIATFASESRVVRDAAVLC
ncbi:MAG: hypothetical protein GDA52_00950 [Rhodobacteraceae bacterium]|nr:hypothetical protein [Paracoccaceae bacterium]